MGFRNFLQKSNIYMTIMVVVDMFLKYGRFMHDKAGRTAKEDGKLFIKVVVKYKVFSRQSSAIETHTLQETLE